MSSVSPDSSIVIGAGRQGRQRTQRCRSFGSSPLFRFPSFSARQQVQPHHVRSCLRRRERRPQIEWPLRTHPPRRRNRRRPCASTPCCSSPPPRRRRPELLTRAIQIARRRQRERQVVVRRCKLRDRWRVPPGTAPRRPVSRPARRSRSQRLFSTHAAAGSSSSARSYARRASSGCPNAARRVPRVFCGARGFAARRTSRDTQRRDLCPGIPNRARSARALRARQRDGAQL